MTCCTGCCFHDPDRGACTYRGQGSDQCWPGGDTCPCRAPGAARPANLPTSACPDPAATALEAVRARSAVASASLGKVILYVDQAASYAEMLGMTDRGESLRALAQGLRAQRRLLRQTALDLGASP